MQVLLFWAQRSTSSFLEVVSELIFLLLRWVLLLLQPDKLIGEERVLHQQLLVGQILDHRNVLHLAHRKWDAADVLELVFYSVGDA